MACFSSKMWDICGTFLAKYFFKSGRKVAKWPDFCPTKPFCPTKTVYFCPTFVPQNRKNQKKWALRPVLKTKVARDFSFCPTNVPQKLRLFRRIFADGTVDLNGFSDSFRVIQTFEIFYLLQFMIFLVI